MEEITYGSKNYTKIPKTYGNVIEDTYAPAPPAYNNQNPAYARPPAYNNQNPAYAQPPPQEQTVYEQPPEEVPQSLRNHALPPTFGGNQDDMLKKLRAQPISGYTAPKKINPSNNRGGTYSRYVDRPGETNINPYTTTGTQHVSKTVFNNAYAVKPCLQCNYPLDKCECSLAQNSRK